MYLFPDTTVLCNFAAVDELSVLKAYVGERGRWVQSIHAEVRKSQAVHVALESVLTEQWLGEPIALDREGEVEQVERFRRVHMYGATGAPLQHLGEAETFVVLQHRSELAGATFLTDDHDAHRVFEHFGIRVGDTRTVLEAAVAWMEITAAHAVEMCARMKNADRVLRRPIEQVADIRTS